MKKPILLALATLGCTHAAAPDAPRPASEQARMAAHAAAVTITRDDWGIAHVRGHTDADAVFGAIYAQAEDDFNRVETNYLTSLGRTAEAEGEKAIWQDLRQRLFIDPDTLRAQYGRSPAWLQTLMTAWADGLNYYLSTHPQTKPKVITHFEPWMALSFSEGSIGGDYERVNLRELEAFYSKPASVTSAGGDANEETALLDKEPGGSNGIAIAPKNNVNGRAMLMINPHTSFFFRSELQMSSDEGLNAYGASTWGQFFLYQGFNDRLGWMHTSSGVDAVDEFVETVAKNGSGFTYKYGNEERPVVAQTIRLAFKTPSGAIAERTFTAYRTHHGPIVRTAPNAAGKWIAFAAMNKPIEALSQSYLRTKARSYSAFRKVMDFKANSSNNTIYADADGHIAYFHPHFIPRRDDRFDYTKPVDGSDPATDWKGLHDVENSPRLLDPNVGWLYNSNDEPWQAAGPDSPKKSDFPKYMDQAGPNPRGPHALRVLSNKHDFTLQGMIDAAFDSYMPLFAQTVPPLVQAYDALPAGDPLKAKLAEPIDSLRKWDYRWGVKSVSTSLGAFWVEALPRAASATDAQRLNALSYAVDKLTTDFGSWRTPWGDINRFQRLTDDIVHPFDDAKPSIPVPFASARYGSLASFGARAYPNTKKWYGTSGNSFVAAVEFGKDSVRARAVTAGGESGDVKSKHFNDQAERYAWGNLRTVYFYPGQLAGHIERVYHPGQ